MTSAPGAECRPGAHGRQSTADSSGRPTSGGGCCPNLIRMACRRFTRLTNAFSKKLENLKAALALHFVHYNLVRLHGSLRVTPAMAARVTDRVWGLEE